MKKSLISVVAILFLISSLSFAQSDVEIDQIESLTSYNYYDFDFVGNGARARGMGNAFIAVSNDVTAGAWNPAGLIDIDKTVLSINWSKLNPAGNSFSVSYPTPGTQIRSDIDHSGSFSNISSANFVSPIRLKGHPFVMSANLTRNFDVFNQLSYETFGPAIIFTPAANGIVYFDTLIFDYNQDFQTSGGVNSVNFGFGTRLYNNITFGVAINIYTGNSILEVNETVHFDSVRYAVTQWAEFDQFTTVRDTNKFSSSNFTFGFKRDGEKLDLGLTIRTPFELKESRQQAIFKITEINGLISSSQTDTTFFQDILYKYEMPWMFGLGFGYQVNDELLVAADFEYRPFSGGEIKYRISQTINPGGDNIEEYLIIDPEWKDVFTFRLGGEYLKEFDFGTVPFRAGFGYVPVADPALSAVTGSRSSVANTNLSAGTGIHWSQVMFDLAYTYSMSDRDFGQYGGAFSFKNHSLNFSFTGVF